MIKISHSLKTTGADAYRRNLGKLSFAVGKAAGDIEARAKKSIEMSSGQYKERVSGLNKDITTWSSPPGTPPNTDIGNLANSIGSAMTGQYSAVVKAGNPIGKATQQAKYAVPLELGWHTKSGTYVPPRPFMRPAVEYVDPIFRKAITVILRGK